MSEQSNPSNLTLSEKQPFCHQGFHGKNNPPYIKLCGGLVLGIGLSCNLPAWSIPNQNESFPLSENININLNKQVKDQDFKPESLSQLPTPENFAPEFAMQISENRGLIKQELEKDLQKNLNADNLTNEHNQAQFELIKPISAVFLAQTEPESSTDVENTEIESSGMGDPELGILRLRELPPPPTSSGPKLYLLGGVGYLYGDNLFSLVDPVDDSLFSGGLTLLLTQTLDPRTSISASVGGGITRYLEESDFDYNQLRLNIDLYRQLNKQTYLEFGWTNQHLFNQSDGDRFLNDNAIYAQIGRKDWFSDRVYLDSYYQFRRRFADPGNRSQFVNSVGLFIGYNPLESLNVGVGYQVGLSNFTDIDRFDNYHQILARLSYSLNDTARFYLFGGRSFGGSTDSDIDFNSWLLGIGIDVNVNLF